MTNKRSTASRGFYQWLRSREDMLILAHLSHGHSAGVAGTTVGRKVWNNGEPDTYPLDWRSLVSVNGGALNFITGALWKK